MKCKKIFGILFGIFFGIVTMFICTIVISAAEIGENQYNGLVESGYSANYSTDCDMEEKTFPSIFDPRKNR